MQDKKQLDEDQKSEETQLVLSQQQKDAASYFYYLKDKLNQKELIINMNYCYKGLFNIFHPENCNTNIEALHSYYISLNERINYLLELQKNKKVIRIIDAIDYDFLLNFVEGNEHVEKLIIQGNSNFINYFLVNSNFDKYFSFVKSKNEFGFKRAGGAKKLSAIELVCNDEKINEEEVKLLHLTLKYFCKKNFLFNGTYKIFYLRITAGDKEFFVFNSNLGMISNLEIIDKKEIIADNFDSIFSNQDNTSNLGKLIIAREKKTDIFDSLDGDGWDIMDFAIWKNDHFSVKYLLNEGFEIKEEKDGSEKTKLHLAAECEDTTILYLILSQISFRCINYKNTESQTPLDVAISKNNIKIAELLLIWEAKISFYEQPKNSKLLIDKEQWKLLTVLLENGVPLPGELRNNILKIDKQDENLNDLKKLLATWSKIHEYIENDDIKNLQQLIEKEKFININYCLDEHDVSPLQKSLYLKKYDIYGYLVSIGARLSSMEKEDDNSFERAVLKHMNNDGDAIIYYLLSLTNILSSENTNESKQKIIKDIYKTLSDNKFLRPILEAMRYFNCNLNIMIDFDSRSVQNMVPSVSNSTMGIYNLDRLTIHIGANDNLDEMRGTIVHEFTHHVCQFIFKNNCNPYSSLDNNSKVKFEQILFDLKGCDIFLTSGEKDIKNSTSISLYLYKDDKGFYYYIEDKEHRLDNLEELIKKKLSLNKFDFMSSENKYEDEEICEAILEVTSKMGHTKSKATFKLAVDRIIKLAFDYKEPEQCSELIVRVPHILAKYGNEKGSEILETQAKNLFTFYKDNFLPECSSFIEKKKNKNLPQQSQKNDEKSNILKEIISTQGDGNCFFYAVMVNSQQPLNGVLIENKDSEEESKAPFLNPFVRVNAENKQDLLQNNQGNHGGKNNFSSQFN